MTTRIKRVDMLHLGTYTEGRHDVGRALLRAFTVVHVNGLEEMRCG